MVSRVAEPSVSKSDKRLIGLFIKTMIPAPYTLWLESDRPTLLLSTNCQIIRSIYNFWTEKRNVLKHINMYLSNLCIAITRSKHRYDMYTRYVRNDYVPYLVTSAVSLKSHGWDVIKGGWTQVPVPTSGFLHRCQHRSRHLIVLGPGIQWSGTVVPGQGFSCTHIRGHRSRFGSIRWSGSSTVCANSIGIVLVHIRDKQDACYGDQNERDYTETEWIRHRPGIGDVHKPGYHSHQQERGWNGKFLTQSKNLF